MINPMLDNGFPACWGERTIRRSDDVCISMRNISATCMPLNRSANRAVLTTLPLSSTFICADWRTRSVLLTPVYCERLTPGQTLTARCRIHNRVTQEANRTAVPSRTVLNRRPQRTECPARSDVTHACGEIGNADVPSPGEGPHYDEGRAACSQGSRHDANRVSHGHYPSEGL
jgi:hypothetical protein